MHTGMAQRMAGSTSRPATGSRSLRRAAQYLTRYGRQALLPYAFLIIATLAQLAVPNMVRRILDAVTGGYLANQVLTVLDRLPAQAVAAALPAMLTALKYPQTLTADDLALRLNETAAAAPQGILTGILAVLFFAVLRGVFAFLQAFWAEKNSQSVAYDLRNDLYAKIQRLVVLLSRQKPDRPVDDPRHR